MRNSPPVSGESRSLSGIFLVLSVLPNLPSLRESRFIAMFDFGPFAGWQRGFSMESALSWVDRSSFLSRSPASSQSDVSTNSSYLGIVGVACVAGFFSRRRAVWQTSQAKLFRLFVALTLFAHWLGLGAKTALSGQFAFLSHANSAWDPAIAISWGLLALQGAAIWLLIPEFVLARPWLIALAILVYFCVPGFRLIGGIRSTRTSARRTIFSRWEACFASRSRQDSRLTFLSVKCDNTAP